MNRKRLVVVVAAVFFVLVAFVFRGCTGGSGHENAPLTNEGLRPDVMAYIDSQYGQMPLVRRAAIQLAHSFQEVLNEAETYDVFGRAPREPALRITELTARAVSCLKFRLEHSGREYRGEEIEKLTFNTYRRARVYLKFNGALSGSVLHLPVRSEEVCD